MLDPGALALAGAAAFAGALGCVTVWPAALAGAAGAFAGDGGVFAGDDCAGGGAPALLNWSRTAEGCTLGAWAIAHGVIAAARTSLPTIFQLFAGRIVSMVPPNVERLEPWLQRPGLQARLQNC